MNAQAGPSRSYDDDEDSGAREGGPRKRTRPNTALACARCRTRKVKCDGVHPICTRCSKDPEKPECSYHDERARQSFKAQNQALRDRILVLESALQSAHPAPFSGQTLPHDDQEGQDDYDEADAVPVTTIWTGSFTLGLDGSLFHSGHNSSFFRTQAVQLEDKPDPRLALYTSYLSPPYLPVPISQALHDEMLELSFARMTRFGVPIHESHFMRQLTTDATQRTAHFSRFLHLILLATGSRYLTDPPLSLCSDGERATRGFVFIDAAKELVDSEGESPKLSAISAFLILSSFMVDLGKDRLAWMHQGIATMVALDFQLDQDARVHLPTLSPTEILLDEARHRSYWTLSIITSYWTTFTGKSSTFPSEVHHQPLPSSIIDIMDPKPCIQSCYAFNARLSKLAIKIVKTVYTSGGPRNRPACSVDRLECVERLDGELDAWHASLPSILLVDDLPPDVEAPPDVVALNMFFHVNQIVLHRPFINGGINKTSMARCFTSASGIVSLLSYASRTSYGQLGLPLHAQHATFCAGTILLLFAAGLDSSGGPAEQAAKMRQAKDDLDDLISFLFEFGKIWPAATESSQALTNLSVDYLLV